MTDTASQLEISREGKMGVIALNRPAAINALTQDMVVGIADQLAAWRDDDQIRAVLFEGRGSRGFCAGGDVRAIRAHVLDGRPEMAEAFFAAEYAMNAMIAAYPKPVIALCSGVVMGGGIGIAGHADFRFATAEARFAMPEAAIGFFCDVGVNAILGRAPVQRALAFAMAGRPVDTADALALGLTDCVIASERVEQVRAALIGAAAAGDVEGALVLVMGRDGIDAGEATLCALADRLATQFGGPTAGDVVVAITEAAADGTDVAALAQVLTSRCPTSLEAILQSHRAARLLPGVDAVLALDLRLARLLAPRPDFVEGVRAVLVDKDGSAQWEPADFGRVPVAQIAAAVASRS